MVEEPLEAYVYAIWEHALFGLIFPYPRKDLESRSPDWRPNPTRGIFLEPP